MHYDTREELSPPAGGIFLSEQPFLPTYTRHLIQELPLLKRQSEEAKARLDDIYADTELDEIATKNTADWQQVRYSPSPYGNYLDSTRTTCKLAAEGGVNALRTLAIAYVENLKEKAHRFDDAMSAVRGIGEKAAAQIVDECANGQYAIGAHTYEVLGYRGRRLLRMCDQAAQQTILYNYWQDIPEPHMRAASPNDYVRLLIDIGHWPGRDSSLMQKMPAANRPLFYNQSTLDANEQKRLANGLHAFSECFWLTRQDLLPEKVGMITDIVNRDDVRLRLFFDARQRGDELFIWRLSRLAPDGLRTLDECEVSPTVITIRSHIYNRTGEPQSHNPVPYSQLRADIEHLLEHSWAKAHEQHLREARQVAIKDIGNSALGMLRNPRSKPYTQPEIQNGHTSMLEEKEKILKKVGFLPESGKPWVPDNDVVWTEEKKRVFLEQMRQKRQQAMGSPSNPFM